VIFHVEVKAAGYLGAQQDPQIWDISAELHYSASSALWWKNPRHGYSWAELLCHLREV